MPTRSSEPEAPPAPPAPSLPYAKMNGIGNAILVVDLRGGHTLDGATARSIGGIAGCAFDQLMAIMEPRHPDAAASVAIFNADGSRAGACGNGTRCVAWFLLEESMERTIVVETDAGRLRCERDGPWRFTVDMGPPQLGWHEIPLRDAEEDTRAFSLRPSLAAAEGLGQASAVGMGNPHVVFWLPLEAPLPDLAAIGPAVETHPMFPERANVSFARAVARDAIALDVWERGAGLTLACGSAACATLVSGARTGRTERAASVRLPGGVLEIAWRESDDHVLMSGAVELEHRGRLDPAALRVTA